MRHGEGTGGMRVDAGELKGRVATIFRRHECSARVAAILSDNIVRAEADGASSHGLFRMPGYVATLKSGWVDGQAEPIVEDAAPGVVRVDAGGGFTQPALAAGRPLLIDKVRHCGIAVIGIRDSQHFAALSLDVEPFAEEGFLALSVINTMAAMVPHGGRRPVFGTNPVAFAAPRAGGPPLVFDQASSVLAHGDVKIAAREGLELPEGAGVDRDGRPTRDPHAVLDGGALLPFGGHKGSSLALMVEILCAAFVGGRFSHEVDWSGHPGAQIPETGQTIILIDPSAGSATMRPLADRVEELVATLRAAGTERLPGERRLVNRATSASSGVFLSHEADAMLLELERD